MNKIEATINHKSIKNTRLIGSILIADIIFALSMTMEHKINVSFELLKNQTQGRNNKTVSS